NYSGFQLPLYLKLIATDYWGYPLGIICLLGCFRALATRSRKGLVLFCTASAIISFKSQHKYIEAKYILHSLPLLAALGGALLAALSERIKKPLLYCIVPLLLAHPLYLCATWDYEHSQPSINLTAKQWIEANIPVNAKILLDNVGNAGPKLHNVPANIKRQYDRALRHQLMKADYLKLLLNAVPEVHYNIVQIDNPGGFREDDYKRYRLWQDLEEIGNTPDYYFKRGFDYIVITDRYFAVMNLKFNLIKEFSKGEKGIRIYRLQQIN
ncbi:MAG: hypothetical protein GY850_39150, partial [bacterium]|nr:hypothetical protein [bacterium]